MRLRRDFSRGALGVGLWKIGLFVFKGLGGLRLGNGYPGDLIYE